MSKLTTKELDSVRVAFDIAKAKHQRRIKSDAQFARDYLERDPSALSRFLSGDYYSKRIHRIIRNFVIEVDPQLSEMIPKVQEVPKQNPEGESV